MAQLRTDVAANVRALGWAPNGAELNLVEKRPRPPQLAAREEDRPCEPTDADFDSPAAAAAWKARRPARVLTIWGVAHYGSRAASKEEAGLCQDLKFLSRQWQAALGRPASGKLSEKDVSELARAISDSEWGRPIDFGRLPVGVDAARGVTLMAGPPVRAKPAQEVTPLATSETVPAKQHPRLSDDQRRNVWAEFEAKRNTGEFWRHRLPRLMAEDPAFADVLIGLESADAITQRQRMSEYLSKVCHKPPKAAARWPRVPATLPCEFRPHWSNA